MDEVIDIIKTYSEILKSGDYYFTHKYTFWDFLQRGYLKFLPELNQKESMLKSGIKIKETAEEQRERIANL